MAEAATYTYATSPGDVEETSSLTKYGFLEDVSLEAMVDPDGARLRQRPDRMGRAMGRMIRQTLINKITTDNPTMGAIGRRLASVLFEIEGGQAPAVV